MVKKFYAYFTALFTIGLVNNLGYVMIASGAQALAKQFDEENFMAMFQLMLVIFSVLILVLNYRYLSAMNTMLRVCLIIGGMAFSFVLISICSATSDKWGFGVALVATVIMGIFQSWGECVMLGFTKSFPPEYVSGFSSGTGFAGVAGAGIILLLKLAGLSYTVIYLCVLPLFGAYLVSFIWLWKKAKTDWSSKSLLVSQEESNLQVEPIPTEESEGKKVSSSSGNALFSMEQLKYVWKKAWFLSTNLGLVYFLEYCIITGFADRATNQNSGSSDYFKANAYVILQFCYQFGVMISRSSLSCFKIKRVWIVTSLQALNFVLWWIEAETIFLGTWLEFILMIWVGCMGGIIYVNVAYLILTNKEMPQSYKEAAMNQNLCINSSAIILSSVFCIILDNFIIT
mmetsp:Transcript_10394/g.15531  ORF Transcript_10394/g.15531 Transcript_10394/m.15531 type:complete len:400 (-) Transcript_10394:711-1910(-)